ncbi:hypothetical protein [Gemmatimonas sp.]|uniref:hypothetical protein n=1 Tax=Gemmatimonas sp. TaxID=1962908 RepID=UPI003567914D
MTLINSWVNLGLQPAQYRKLGDMVYIRGQIQSGASGTSAFTVPVGFRPPTSLDLSIVAYSGGAVVALASVQAGGPFNIWTAATGNVSINCQWSVTV